MTELHWYYLFLGFIWVPALVIIGAITLVGVWVWRCLMLALGWMENFRG